MAGGSRRRAVCLRGRRQRGRASRFFRASQCGWISTACACSTFSPAAARSGIESLSRGAAYVTFVDSSRDAAAAIRANLAQLDLSDRARIVVAEVHRALADLGRAHESFDLVFVDAPFKDDMSAEVLALLGEFESRRTRRMDRGRTIEARARRAARSRSPRARIRRNHRRSPDRLLPATRSGAECRVTVLIK